MSCSPRRRASGRLAALLLLAASVHLGAAMIVHAQEKAPAEWKSRPAPELFFNRYCEHWGELGDDFLDYTAAVKPQIVQVGFFGPGYYSAWAYMEEKDMPKLWASLGGGPRDRAWWKDHIAKQHAQGVKVLGQFSLSLVFGDHEKGKGFFDFWDNRWDAAALGPRPTKPDGSPVKAIELMQVEPTGLWIRRDYQEQGGAEYQACPSNPYYREALKRMVKAGIDLGLDGYAIVFPKRESCICTHCQAGFRKYLAARHTPAQLQEKFAITDLATHRFEKINGWYEAEDATPFALEALKFSLLVVADAKREVFLDYGRSLKPDLIVGQWNHIYRSSMSDGGQQPGTFMQLNGDEQSALPTELWSKDENFVWYSIGNWTFGNMYFNPEKHLWGSFSLEHKYLKEAGRGLPQAVKRDDATNVRVYIAEAVGHGGFGYARGPQYRDPFTREQTARYFDFLRQHEDLYHPVTSYADVALVFPRSAIHQGDKSAIADFKAIGKLLTDRHVLFDVAVDEQLTPQRRQGYRVVIEPRPGALTPENDPKLAAALERPVSPPREGMVAVAWQQPEQKRIALHLINHLRGPHPAPEGVPPDDPRPQERVALRLHLPDGAQAARVRLLSPDQDAERPLEFRQDGNVLSAAVDRVLVYSVVVVEMR